MHARRSIGQKVQLAFLAAICLLPRIAAAAEAGHHLQIRWRQTPVGIGLSLMVVGGVGRLAAKLLQKSLQKLASKYDKGSSSS